MPVRFSSVPPDIANLCPMHYGHRVLAFGAFSAALFHFLRHEASWCHANKRLVAWTWFRRGYITFALASLVLFLVGIAIIGVGFWRAL
jgi:hypothetical protein